MGTRSVYPSFAQLPRTMAHFPPALFKMRLICSPRTSQAAVMRSGRFHRINNSERGLLRPFVFTLALLLLSLAATGPTWAAKPPPIGSHIPEMEHPFAIPPVLWRSLFAATTPSGQHLSASQIAPLVRRQYWPAGTYTRTHWHLKIGVFLLNVRSDGTVSNVEILQSTGHKILDANCVSAFSKWQFQPNSVKEVRLPAYYTVSR
jgi:TonB family protein